MGSSGRGAEGGKALWVQTLREEAQKKALHGVRPGGFLRKNWGQIWEKVLSD